MIGYYILEGKETKYVGDDTLTWAQQFEDFTKRRVNRTFIEDVDISTVFLGMDHDFTGKGPPLLFETMVFGGELDQEMDRCSTWEEAEKMHDAMCERVRQTMK